jgi:murein DD-endopeptidase MepM/ murein hydrolase activator NlpD
MNHTGSNVRRVRLLGLLMLAVLVLAGSCQAQPKEYNSKNVLIITSEIRGDEEYYTFKNLETYDITVTMNFSHMQNVQSSVRMPYTRSLAGGETVVHPFKLTLKNRSAGWNYRFAFHWIPGNVAGRHNDSYTYRLPYPSGKSFLVLQGFNGRFSHFGNDQYCIDWDMPVGTPVLASRGGVVTGARGIHDGSGTDEGYRDRNNYVMIKHDDGTVGEYCHFKMGGVTVKVGQRVSEGDLIGYSGNVGYSTQPHLHFGVYKANDGFSKRTFPIKFKTTSSRREILKERKSYQAP